jgi:hypothetical protein
LGHQVDDLRNDAMTSGAAASIMKKLEQSLEEEELAQEKAEAPAIGQKHGKHDMRSPKICYIMVYIHTYIYICIYMYEYFVV